MTVTETGPLLVELPREGYELYFREDKHAYQMVNPKGEPGMRYPGVSTIGHAFPDTGIGLKFWTETTTCEGYASVVASILGEPVTWPQLEDHELLERIDRVYALADPHIGKATLARFGLRWTQVLRQTADRGKRAHELMLEALARGGEVPDLEQLPEDERGYGQAVFKWWSARKPKPLNVEQVVLSLVHGFAGRFDLRGTIEAPGEWCHGTGIVDLKTGKGITDRNTGKVTMPRSDHVQIKGYEIGSEECHVGGADWLMILQVRPDGTYREHKCCATTEDFHLALESHKAANRMDRDLRAAA